MNNTNPIFLTTEIRKIEQLATAMPDPPNLMEKAGLAAAQIARDELLNDNQSVLVLAGPGNNGGDAFVVARYLKQWGYNVDLVFMGNPDKQPHDAKHAMNAWHSVTDNCHNFDQIPENKRWDAAVDGLFGIGIGLDQSNRRNLSDIYAELINTVNKLHIPVLALDIPSGLSSDNGCIHGAIIRATITVTFIGQKPGLLTNDGPEYCGKILLCKLDLDAPKLLTPHNWVLDQKLIQPLLPPPRPANSHKGTLGSIGIIGGSAGMVGAALLAGRSALKLGAGRVYLGLIDQHAPTVDFIQPELMLRLPHELFKLKHLNCLIVGPGLGMHHSSQSDSRSWLDDALDTAFPLVLDADALNQIAAHTPLANKLSQRKQTSILTPHPAEAARLLKTDIVTIQSNRLGAALTLSKQFNCHVVLKGAGSICALTNGECYFNTSGNPGLSSAGTGDILSGMIGSLITQSLSLKNALLLAVYLHGVAADELLKNNNGPIGMTASEIIISARNVLNQWVYKLHKHALSNQLKTNKPKIDQP